MVFVASHHRPVRGVFSLVRSVVRIIPGKRVEGQMIGQPGKNRPKIQDSVGDMKGQQARFIELAEVEFKSFMGQKVDGDGV